MIFVNKQPHSKKAGRPMLKAWRQDSGNLDNALCAARHYSRKWKKPFIVVPHYQMSHLSSDVVLTHSITMPNSSVGYFHGMVPPQGHKVYIVGEDGSVQVAQAYDFEKQIPEEHKNE